jgi:hypothetical protein
VRFDDVLDALSYQVVIIGDDEGGLVSHHLVGPRALEFVVAVL